MKITEEVERTITLTLNEKELDAINMALYLFNNKVQNIDKPQYESRIYLDMLHAMNLKTSKAITKDLIKEISEYNRKYHDVFDV